MRSWTISRKLCVYLNTDGTVLKQSIAIFSFLVAVLFALHSNAQQLDTHTEVIANLNVGQDSISVRQLRRVFMLKQRSWEDGQPISLIVFSSEDEKHAAFLRHSLKLFPYQLDREWNKLVYSGQSAPPIVASDAESMLQIVGSTPGAVGYLVSSSIDAKEELEDLIGQRVKKLEVTSP
jgi:ABC-type phosphate transport system substrate-binding protein